MYNKLQVRGEGQIVKSRDALIRPAQISTEHRYDDAIAFYHIDELDENFREHQVSCINTENIRVNKRYVDGLHTYSVSEKYEAIDIRCRDFDVFKPIRKIKQYLK